MNDQRNIKKQPILPAERFFSSAPVGSVRPIVLLTVAAMVGLVISSTFLSSL